MLSSSNKSCVSSVNVALLVFLERHLWPSFTEMALYLKVVCPSALPPGIFESSRATVNDDQTFFRRESHVPKRHSQPVPMVGALEESVGRNSK